MIPERLKKILPECREPEKWAAVLNEELPKYGIDTRARIAAFLGQVGHESAHLNVLVENLNYSAAGLRRVFPKYFPTDALAKEYARRPAAIASRVYASRMGNSDEKSGDGWRYRGRGLIQCTGKNNYRACSVHLFGDERLLENPDLLIEPKYAVLSALWFWSTNMLNAFADDIDALTKRVNGGTNGLADRKAITERALFYL